MNGIEILLEPKTSIPSWLRNLPGAQISRGGAKEHNFRKIRILKIPKGEAIFLPGGSVGILPPRFKNLRVAFGPKKVLEIHDSAGKLLKRNWYLCKSCFALTGMRIDYQPGSISGRQNSNFSCGNCDSGWYLENI